MMLRKRLYIFIVALFVVFAGLSTCCYGYCGFEGACPNSVPPCYRVTISGVLDCSNCDCISQPPECEEPFENELNGTYILPYVEGDCKWWDGGNVDLSMTSSQTNVMGGMQAFDCYGPWGTGSCSNLYADLWDFCQYGGGYEGSASWEPIWDCRECSNCDLTVNKSPDTTIHFANESCCPTAGTGESYSVTISCSDADAVIAEVGSYDESLVTVTYKPGCREGSSASFGIQALKGAGDKSTTVTCTALFFSADGESAGEGMVTVEVKPHCGECCEPGKKGDPADCPSLAGEV